MLSMKNLPSIILIGMPGAGKSTLGVLLAKTLAIPFIDTDILIQEHMGETLQAHLDREGYQSLRKEEEKVLLDLNFTNTVIATGGSVVYSAAGMEALAKAGLRVYLKISYDTLIKRVNNQGERGLACKPGTTLKDLYDERYPLYERYADLTVVIDDCNFDEALALLLSSLEQKFA